MSELTDLLRRIQEARETGQEPALVMMSPANWFRVKATYVDATGEVEPTFMDVLGLDVRFIGEGDPCIVSEQRARKLTGSTGLWSKS